MQNRENFCTVWVHKYVAGWDGSDETPEFHATVTITDALQDCYKTDAHFVPYYIEVLDASGE